MKLQLGFIFLSTVATTIGALFGESLWRSFVPHPTAPSPNFELTNILCKFCAYQTSLFCGHRVCTRCGKEQQSSPNDR